MNNQDIINVVNRLVETCKDGEFGFRSCAEHVQDEDLHLVLANRSLDCQRAAAELQELVSELGGNPEVGGTASGALHRGWVAVKSSLSGYSDHAMLAECERGEDIAMARYRDALGTPLPDSVRGVVERQYEGVKQNHAQVRALRDSARVTS